MIKAGEKKNLPVPFPPAGSLIHFAPLSLPSSLARKNLREEVGIALQLKEGRAMLRAPRSLSHRVSVGTRRMQPWQIQGGEPTAQLAAETNSCVTTAS